MKKAIFFVLIFCIYSVADAACIRCALDKLACTGDSRFSLISQCGNPDNSEIVVEDTEGHAGQKSYGEKQRTVEKMYYNCGDGRFIKIVTVKDGKIISIEDGERGSGPVKCD